MGVTLAVSGHLPRLPTLPVWTGWRSLISKPQHVGAFTQPHTLITIKTKATHQAFA